MRIAFYEIREVWEREQLERDLADHELRLVPEVLAVETAALAEEAQIVSTFIRSRVDAAVLERLPELRLLTTRSTGYDHIDVEACRRRGVTVSHVPRYAENTVAEHTFGLILNLSRKIHQAYLRTRGSDFSLDGLEGIDLRARTLGVVGAGAIGLHVIRIGRAFGMEVLAYDVHVQPMLAEVLGFRYAELEEVLSAADVITLHVPLLPETRHLMNRERFRLVKPGALLINTARGAVVDTEALLWALDEGILAGAGLDVLEGEELLVEEKTLFRTAAAEAQLRQVIGGHLLLERENVIITPHMAWYSRDARRRILATTVENIRGFVAGRPTNTVDAAPAARP